MTKNERLVRETWERVHVCDGSYRSYDGSYRSYDHGTVLINYANHCFYDFPDFDAAADFTRTRIEEVRQLKEEMRLLESMIILLRAEPGDTTAPIYKRTLTRLTTELAKLTQGMKGGGQ